MTRSHHRKESSAQNLRLDRPPTNIPEDEQWRLVNQSGILGKVSDIHRNQAVDGEHLAEEIFGAVLLIIPFSSLLLMMEMFVTFSPCESVLAEAFFREEFNSLSIRAEAVLSSSGGQDGSRCP
jgi:hypothetical protein